MKKLFFVTAILMMMTKPAVADRNSGVADGATTGTATTATTSTTNGSTTSTGASPTASSTVAQPSGTGVVAPTIVNPAYRTNLNDASSSQGNYAMIGAAVSGALAVKAYMCYTACSTSSCRRGCIPWALASVGAAAVAMHNSSKASENANAAGQFTVDPGTTDGASTGVAQTSSLIQYQNALKPLDQAGMKYDLKNGTVTTPDGKTFNQSDMVSPASMAAAGLNPADFGKVKDMLKKAEKDASSSLKGVDGGSGSDIAGGGGKTSSEVAPSTTGLSFNPNEKLGLNRDPAQVAGLSKDLNGEPIGVAADSIFGIIDRRYQLHKDQGSFLMPGQ